MHDDRIAAAEELGRDEDDEQERHREHQVDEAHQDAVDPAAEEPGDARRRSPRSTTAMIVVPRPIIIDSRAPFDHQDEDAPTDIVGRRTVVLSGSSDGGLPPGFVTAVMSSRSYGQMIGPEIATSDHDAGRSPSRSSASRCCLNRRQAICHWFSDSRETSKSGPGAAVGLRRRRRLGGRSASTVRRRDRIHAPPQSYRMRGSTMA